MPKYVGTATRGHFWLENDGHVFHRERTSTRSDTHQWRCASHNIPKCNARLSTRGKIAEDVEPELVKREKLVPHNHPPDIGKILLKEALTEVRKQIVARPNESVNSIVNAVVKYLPPEILQGPKVDNLKRAGQRARKRLLEEQTSGVATAGSSSTELFTSNNFSAENLSVTVKGELEYTDVYANNYSGWGESMLYDNTTESDTTAGTTELYSPSGSQLFPAAICSPSFSDNENGYDMEDALTSILGAGQSFGIIGGGTMAKAIVFRLFDLGLIDANNVIVSGTNMSRLQPWADYGCKTVTNNSEVLHAANVVLWALKPQIFPKAIDGLSKEAVIKSPCRSSLHISVMAGIPLGQFNSKLKECAVIAQDTLRTVRVMPNIALRVGSGCAVFAMGPSVLPGDKELVSNLFTPSGICCEVQEPQINAFCGLFGSGIGFMFPVLEAMSDGAVKCGIPRELSLKMAAQTMKGAAELLLQEKVHPGVLKDAVCSPGGTTIAGIAELEKYGLRNAIINAIDAATKRGEELGRLSGTSK